MANEKTPEEIAAERYQTARALREAISHFQVKLRFVDNETTIENQLKVLVNYNDFPSVDEISTSTKNLDSYRQEFMLSLYDMFFTEYPEMLEKLGDKKSTNNMENFLALSLLSHLIISNNEEVLKKEHKDNVTQYYQKVLPMYQEFLMRYIVDNSHWELSCNSKEAFALHVKLYEEHKAIVDRHEGNIIMNCHMIIKDVYENLLDKVVELGNSGIDEETYSHDVTDYIISKYTALRNIMNHMAGAGMQGFCIWVQATFKEFTISDIERTISAVESKLKLNAKQKEELAATKKMITTLMSKGIGAQQNSGCLGMLLALIIPTATILALCL